MAEGVTSGKTVSVTIAFDNTVHKEYERKRDQKRTPTTGEMAIFLQNLSVEITKLGGNITSSLLRVNGPSPRGAWQIKMCVPESSLIYDIKKGADKLSISINRARNNTVSRIGPSREIDFMKTLVLTRN